MDPLSFYFPTSEAIKADAVWGSNHNIINTYNPDV